MSETTSPTPVSGDAMELVERLELPDDVRVPLHSLQADVGYLIGRVQADGSCGSEIAASIISRLTAIEMAVLRLRSQGAPDVRGRPSPLSPYHEQDDDSIAALASARKGAASDKDAAAIAWAEDEIAALRQAEQAAVRLANELAGKLAKLRSQGGAPEGTPPKPVRERLDWTEYKFGECEECDERRNLGRDQNGALICGSCSDERYTAELEGYANALRATLSTDTKDGGGA